MRAGAVLHPGDDQRDHRSAREIVWAQVAPRHYSSSTFFQYKSILKHAGLLAPHRLGGASVAAYDRAADVWERMPADAGDAGEVG